MNDPLTKEEAIAFFAGFFGGSNHIPHMKEWGDGWCVTVTGCLSTYDYADLTRLVFLAHDYGYRVEVSSAMRHLRIAISRRAREGSISQRHPTLDQAIQHWRKTNQQAKEVPRG